MKVKDILDAYIRIRQIDNTIPDEVLDFMKRCAIERLEKQECEDAQAARQTAFNLAFGSKEPSYLSQLRSYLRNSQK